MKKGLQISPKLIELILEKYQLKANKIFDNEKGYRNLIVPIQLEKPAEINVASKKKVWKKVCLVFLKNEPQIINRTKNAHIITKYLANKSLPVRTALNPDKSSAQTLLKISDNHKTRYACVYTYLPGSTISWETYTKKHIKLLGQVLSLLHQQLNQGDHKALSSKTDLPDVSQIIAHNLKNMEAYFSNKDVKNALLKKLNLEVNFNKLRSFNDLVKISDKNKNIIHLDFVRSNLLFSSLKKEQIIQQKLSNLCFDFEPTLQNSKQKQYLTITGILDFEKSAYGPLIVDIARTLAFLLVDCKYKTERKIRKYFLHSGYQKRGNNELPDLSSLNNFIDYFLLFDFYKFLRHNPYQFLVQNQHFLRTRDYLIKNNIIQK
ncbi:MAG: phosphotransferase [Patescibacteria group bacterium]|nr:phosphotransferase [Patescibacteria group bacterium]